MGISYDLMKQIVANGSNLIIEGSVTNDLLLELVNIAVASGSHITIPSNISNDLLNKITSLGGNHVTVVSGQ